MKTISFDERVADTILAPNVAIAAGVSGGKDSWVLALELDAYLKRVKFKGPKILIHADLGRVEWKDSLPACHRLAERIDWPLVTVARKAGGMMERWLGRWEANLARYRNLECVKIILPWSTASMRFCTAELKRDVICSDLVKRFPGHTIISANGIRRDESTKRKKSPITKVQKKLTNKKWNTTGFDWHPILEWTLPEVWTRLDGLPIHEAYAKYGSSRVSCAFCLAGETEVVTRNGIVPIASLAGGRHPLLIPKPGGMGGHSGHGVFRDVEVRSFGRQRLWKIELRKCRQRKTVYATAEHRWFVVPKNLRGGRDEKTRETTTSTLSAGDRLRAISAHPPLKTTMVPFAVAQGFIYGDGTKSCGDRPARLTIYDTEKDTAMLPFFEAHETKTGTSKGKPTVNIYGLPRLWKNAPDYGETRPFLLSWLSGYFAADGQVTTDGTARLDSANRKSLEIARDVAAICGIGYGPIRHVTRIGTGTEPTKLYSVTLGTRHLPYWFFHIRSHRQRIVRKATGRESELRRWTVVSVSKTDRHEEVFCAVVPGASAFALSNDLLTGNCILGNKSDLQKSTTCEENQDIYREMVELEAASTFAFQDSGWLGDVSPHLLSKSLRSRLKEAKAKAQQRIELEAQIPEHLLYEKGWPTCMPTLAEADFLAQIRSGVAAILEIKDCLWTSPDGVMIRYQQLMDEKTEDDEEE